MSKILVFSIPPINKNSNNTFEHLFKNIKDKHELVFLNCRDGSSDSDTFKELYTLSEKLAFQSIFNRKIDVFRKVITTSSTAELIIYKKKNNHFKTLKRIIRDFLWSLSKWKKSSLSSFLKDQSFDYIVAPSEGYHYYLKILKYICTKTKAKLIFYTWDDNFTFKQEQLSPLFFFYRLKTRSQLKSISKHFVYKHISISEKTKHEVDRFFKTNSIIIKKTIPDLPVSRLATNDINIIYAGNLLNGRDRTLLKTAKLIQNNTNHKFILKIYSNIANKKIKRKLTTYKNVFVFEPISYKKLLVEESQSNIGLLLESLSFSQRKISRLSISTKFIDYVAASLPILAIIDNESATAFEIKNNNLGYVASNKIDILKALNCLENKSFMAQLEQSISFYKENNNHKKQNQLIDYLFE